MPRPRLLYVTDLAYPARGRRYGDEDVHLAADLRAHFDLALCHPGDAAALMDAFDGVVVRNSGPVLGHQEAWDAFRERALREGVPVFNQLTGKADMAGKQYLLDLYAAGYPVIPTVDDPRELHRLPPADAYVAKPKRGADSIGLRVLSPEDAAAPAGEGGDVLLQPRIDFAHEVSFYFVDRVLHYALYAPRPEERWRLEPWQPTVADREFAQRFVDWNAIDHGIQRVDACRTRDGGLLLVELEDLNPYLSLDALDTPARAAFTEATAASVRALLTAS